MRRRLLLVFCCWMAGFGCATAAEPVPGQFRIVGYLPDYRAAEFDAVAAAQLTDLILFSAEPTPAGGINWSRWENISREPFRAFKTKHRIRLILCVGGWDRSQAFAAVSTAPEKRAAFAQAAVKLCLEERLDGIDLDWEHPQTPAEQQGYADLLTELRAAFQPHGLCLSITMAGWQQVPEAGFQAVDWVQVMAYDHPGKHSLLENAQQEIRSLQERKVPAHKLVLGLPFYGRNIETRDALTYGEIVAQHKPAANLDEVAGIYFNGPRTIRTKTEYARQAGLGGVMAWELGQDARGEQSLLRVIRKTVGAQR